MTTSSSLHRVVIPHGLVPGDTFVAKLPNGSPITLVVPPNASGGSCIDITAPVAVTETSPINFQPTTTDSSNASSTTGPLVVDRTTVGAGLVAGLLGLILCGPIGGIICGGGAMYVSKAHGNTEVGRRVNEVGDETCNCLLRAQQAIADRVVLR